MYAQLHRPAATATMTALPDPMLAAWWKSNHTPPAHTTKPATHRGPGAVLECDVRVESRRQTTELNPHVPITVTTIAARNHQTAGASGRSVRATTGHTPTSLRR